MLKNSNIIFKGRRDGITIMLDDSIPFDALKDAMVQKMSGAKQFFSAANTNVSFKGRALTDEEEDALLDIIVKNSGMDITYAKSETGQTLISSQTEQIDVTQKAVVNLVQSDNMTHFRKGSLRSGQSIRYAGSVVLMGDVNPGAEIVAEGNVVVLGAIKGMVHAGCSGNRECYVSSFDMRPTQMRIADLITYVPKEMQTKRTRTKTVPTYAYISEGQIYIETLVV